MQSGVTAVWHQGQALEPQVLPLELKTQDDLLDPSASGARNLSLKLVQLLYGDGPPDLPLVKPSKG